MQMQVLEENIIIGNDASSSHYTTHRNTKNKKSQTGSFGIQHKMKTSAMMANSFMGNRQYLWLKFVDINTPKSQIQFTLNACSYDPT